MKTKLDKETVMYNKLESKLSTLVMTIKRFCSSCVNNKVKYCSSFCPFHKIKNWDKIKYWYR